MALRNLFCEGRIGSLMLKNRIVLPATASSLPEKGGYVSRRLIDFHAARANGGCGLNIVEIAAVSKESKAPHTLGIYEDGFVPGLAELTNKVKTAGGKSCIQLWHAGRQTRSSLSGCPVVAPSPIPCPVCREMPRELSADEIKRLVQDYASAAVRAKKAGFDAIEIHGAHGYLIAQFLSLSSNQRSDDYGGALANRVRFPIEVIREIRGKVGGSYPIVFRMSVEERVKEGLTVGESKEIAALLEAAGVDAIHVSMGTYASMQYMIPPIDLPLALNVESAAAIKSMVKIPVIVAGRINDPLLAERILDEGKADFISVGRGQLADPEFCNKAFAGDFEGIVKCIACNQGCLDRHLYKSEAMSCLRNPSCGRETEYQLVPALKPRKVLIAGGGPAGLEAAITLRRRGHDVVLFEKAGRLGGVFYLAGAAPRKGEMGDAAIHMGRLALKEGVEIHLQTEVTPEIIEERDPDVVIVATGSRPVVPGIPGVLKPHVTTAASVLEGKQGVGDRVVVIGGGLVGVEVAEFLAEQGKKVVIIEMLQELARDLGGTRRGFSLEGLRAGGVQVFTEAACKEIRDGSIVMERSGGTEELRDIDSVVIAVGSISESALVGHLKKTGREFHVIGDARKPRKALDAVWEAAEIARKI